MGGDRAVEKSRLTEYRCAIFRTVTLPVAQLRACEYLHNFCRSSGDASRLGQMSKVQANLFIAVEHMVLRAVSLGLGTCWTGAFDREKLQKAFKLPENILPFIMLPVGYPAQTPRERPRLSLEEIIIEPPESIDM